MNKKICLLGLMGLVATAQAADDVDSAQRSSALASPLLASPAGKRDGMTVTQVVAPGAIAAVLPEFSRYVADSTGDQLSLFGAAYFSQAPSTFAPLQNMNVPDDYVIGAGDELQIRGWGHGGYRFA